MENDNELNPRMNNQRALKHGGAAAVKAIQHRRDFTGVPAVRETEVRTELAEQGRPAIVERNAIRLQTAADIYYDAAIKAFQDGDLDKADSYTKMYAWLAAAALRAWGEVAADEKDAAKGGSVSTIDAIASLRRAKDAQTNPE